MYADGVRAGGFRQTAYSDSHQELVKSVQRISTEEIQILSSAQKKRSIEAAFQAQQESRNAPVNSENDEIDPLIIEDDKTGDPKQTANHKIKAVNDPENPEAGSPNGEIKPNCPGQMSSGNNST